MLGWDPTRTRRPTKHRWLGPFGDDLRTSQFQPNQAYGKLDSRGSRFSWGSRSVNFNKIKSIFKIGGEGDDTIFIPSIAFSSYDSTYPT